MSAISYDQESLPESPCQPAAEAGPEMVLIAAGTFQMGANANPSEMPQHQVTLLKPFAIGRCEVTLGEFRQFVDATGYQTEAEIAGGCNWRVPGFSQTEQHPVVCLSWNDTQAYIAWLNEALEVREKPYRLPTEAEWEFAARAGSRSAFYWGAASSCEYANSTATDCDDGFQFTAPVARFKPNNWGLYDMAGNVWEWVEDCWHKNYQNAPDNGQAWLETEGGECDRRVLRGGSWLNYNGPGRLRSAHRRYRRDDGDDLSGIRLARTL